MKFDYQIGPEYFQVTDEFLLYAYYFMQANPHFNFTTPPPNILDHYIFTEKDENYFIVGGSRSLNLYIYFSKLRYAEKKSEKYVMSMWSVTDLYAALSYLSPFIPLGEKTILGHKVLITEDKISIIGIYSQSHLKMKKSAAVKYTSLDIMAHYSVAPFIALLIPDAQIFCPKYNFITTISLSFNGNNYSVSFKIETNPKNIAHCLRKTI